MIDTTLRHELSSHIRRLATGRMTNDDFDDVYYERYIDSPDRGIRAIAHHCYCLYSSDLLTPIRLRGKYALDAASKRTIARCVLFLRSSEEYRWQDPPDNPTARYFASFCYSLLMPGGIAVALIGLAMLVFDPEPFAFVLLAFGLPAAIAGWYFAFRRPFVSQDAWDAFLRTGDFDCWPFHRRESFYRTRASILTPEDG